MRKDVKRLSDIYQRRDAAIGSDLDALGWPAKPSDQAVRYATLLSPIDFSDYSKNEPLRLLDVGCGLGLLLEYLTANSLLDRVNYTGVGLLDSILKEAPPRWPGHRFDQRDVRDEPYDKDKFDYCIVFGVFTVKHGNTYHEARVFAQDTLKGVWPSVKLGLAFNSMSKHVDWKCDDLFYWPLDEIMAFCKRDLSRHVTFRPDFGLSEAATLVSKGPLSRLGERPLNW